MIYFPVLRTRRLTVQLRELSIGESIALAGRPEHLDEANCTAFLRSAVASSRGGPSDPALWTVQERLFAVCHYLASTATDGPDFSVGAGRYMHYMDSTDVAVPETLIELGMVGGDTWHIRHLTGAMAEAIERAQGDAEGLEGRSHWLLGGMAAQLVRSGESPPDETEGGFDSLLLQRMQVLARFPESDFMALMLLYNEGRDRLQHLFRIDFQPQGIVVLPNTGGVAAALPPARFPAHTCLSSVAKNLVGKPHESGLKPRSTLQHLAPRGAEPAPEHGTALSGRDAL